MKYYKITLNEEKLKDSVLKEALYHFILSGYKFKVENNVVELEIKDDDIPIEEGTAKAIAELSAIAEKVITEKELKEETSKAHKTTIKEIKEITDFAKEAEDVEAFKQKIKSFLEEKGIKEEKNPLSFKDWKQVIDSVVELALKNEEISWKTIKADEKQQRRLNATIRRRLIDENTNFSALQFLRIVAEKVTKYFRKDDEEQNNMEISNNEVQNIESQNVEVEDEDIEARRELEKFLESKLTNLNVDEDSVTVKVTKILKLMEFQNKKDREIMRKFLTLVIRPMSFSLDRALTKLSLDFDCTVFEIRILLSEIINKIIPQANIKIKVEEFCIVIRKIANSSIREREREIIER